MCTAHSSFLQVEDVLQKYLRLFRNFHHQLGWLPCKNKNNLFRLVTLNLFWAFLLLGLGNLIYSVAVLSRISDRRYDSLFEWSRFVASLGPGIMRTTFLAIVIERVVATIFYKVYENSAPIAFGIAMFIFGVGCFSRFSKFCQ